MTKVCHHGAGSPKSKYYGKYEPLSPQGCYDDVSSSPDLTRSVFVVNMTPESCISKCKTVGSYKYAGTQVGSFGYSQGKIELLCNQNQIRLL